MSDCDCTACRNSRIELAELDNLERVTYLAPMCYRETEEAIVNRARRDEMARIVDRWVWVRPIDRLPDRSRKSIPLSDILKDNYGPVWYPYSIHCELTGRSRYEQRRERVMGIPYRTRINIALSLGYGAGRDRLYELAYRENPLFSLFQKQAISKP